MGYGDSGDAAGEFAGTGEFADADADGGRLVHPCLVHVGQIAAKQNGHALKHAGPESGTRGKRQAAHLERATDLSAARFRPECKEGGPILGEDGPGIFLHASSPPVQTASPNPPEDSLGVLGDGAVLGRRPKTEARGAAKGPRSPRHRAKYDVLPPGNPGAL